MIRILVVDDEPEILRATERVLVRAGFAVDTALDLGAAVALAEKVRFGLALVDQRLPDGTGLDLLHRLRATQPGCQRMLMSGYLDLPVALGAVNAGEVARVLEKPVSTEILLESVRAALRTQDETSAALRSRPAAADGEREHFERVVFGPDFHLALQPVLHAPEGTVLGHEAFLRTGDARLPDPRAVLDAATRLGLFRELGTAVVGAAAPILRGLPEDQLLFLNLHPAELDDIVGLRQRVGPIVPWAGRIVFELPGLAHERWGHQLRGRLELLREAGFRFSVDDIGAGVGALALLAEVEPAFIKADLSLVHGIDGAPMRQRLVDLLLRFATTTGARLIASGVETAAEAETLQRLGVPLLQGYHLGRPAALRLAA